MARRNDRVDKTSIGDRFLADNMILRSPDTVLRLNRLGAFHQTRLSFIRAMLRHVEAAGYVFDYSHWAIDRDGVGDAVLTARGNGQIYSLVCFAHDLAPAMRTDRVIAEAWDATYTLFDGIPDAREMARLRENTPRQEAGRYVHTDLILSRTNKSARLFDDVVECLAKGRQPDAARLDDVGYVMRTTAVYGNGKFGIADRCRYAVRDGWGGPFRLEMLTVWMIRQFVADLIDHMAKAKGGRNAVSLEKVLRRRLGLGNSTGLGLGPFIVNHPALFARWVECREIALALVCAQRDATPDAWQMFRDWIYRAERDVAGWLVPDALQSKKIAALREDLSVLAQRVAAMPHDHAFPWSEICSWAADNMSLDGQELVVSLVIEPHGDLVDHLADEMAVDTEHDRWFDPSMSVLQARRTIEDHFAWALKTDYARPAAQARFWYVSSNKLEPRLGERWEEPGAELELPLAVGRDIAACHDDLRNCDDDELVSDFLRRHSQHRHVLRRLRNPLAHQFGHIRDNLIGTDLLPLDMLRCKLAFFGATRFDPKSDRWLRINMFRNAPYPDEVGEGPLDDWIFPRSDA
ncbi:MAG: hypothetical protein OXC93_14650 [Rhodospirillaceae bacterium]|nr:hypothetical protein [Rhodospirillaceae bacterium]